MKFQKALIRLRSRVTAMIFLMILEIGQIILQNFAKTEVNRFAQFVGLIFVSATVLII